MKDIIDKTEILLAHLVCADASGDDNVDYGGRRFSSNGAEFAATDVGVKLKFRPMRPRLSYTFQSIDADVDQKSERIFTTDARLLLASVQDLLGSEAEVAFLCGDRVKWTGLRRLVKAPRGVWVASPGATMYEFHYREIFESGASTYFKRVCAISKSGKPVQCLIEGSRGSGANMEGEQAVIAASVIEDAHRHDALTATISESGSIIVPVPLGEHKELFALRDAPLTPSGRRKAILHWVASHTRKTRGDSPITVQEHTRGVREFSIDGMTVRLEPNRRQDVFA